MHVATSEAQCAHAGMTTLDKAGVCVSGLCAMHCVLTPVLLSIWPMFGKAWGGTATHWIIAALVVPLAVVAFAMGYRHHRRLWIPLIAAVGITLILVAILTPGIAHHHHVENESVTLHDHDASAPHTEITEQHDHHDSILSESAVTITGSLFLIVAHIANLRLAKCGCKAK